MDLLSIYVEDHLALSTAGIRLARRCLAENPVGALARFLARFVAEVEEERAVLEDVARALGTRPSPVKETAAAVGEWLGRLKPNGRVLGYSELSRVWELEALMAGSESRRGLWKLLGKAARRDERLRAFDLAPLEERARGHRDELDRQRLRAAGELLGAAAARQRAPSPAPAR
jgi:hypothetical protein